VTHQRRAAMIVQAISTIPKGHAPCKKPYTDAIAQAAANARMYQALRFSSA
jgi:hypothetical protein